jgi:hemerythrin-like metal-binding protein
VHAFSGEAALSPIDFIARCQRDHKILHSLYNDMVIAYNRHFRRTTTEKILHILSMYTKVHFSMEERFMTAYRFQDQAGHRQSHETFMATLADLKKCFEAGDDIYDRLRVLYAGETNDHVEAMDADLIAFARVLEAAEPGVLPGGAP